jgi:hypothetical protein
MEDYKLGDNISINEEDSIVWVKNLISEINFEDGVSFDLILDYAVNLFIEKISRIGREEIILHYSSESNLLETTLETEDIKKQALYVERLLGGRELFKDVNHLLLKIYSIFKPYSNADLVHLEILLSNCLRDKNNLSLPARLSKVYNPILINIKEAIFRSGFLQALNFENINKAITNSLVLDEPDREQTILEKLLLNEVIVDPKKKK